MNRPSEFPVPFVGDLSTQDAAALTTMARRAHVLEFGCGGSTQIFAAVAASVVSVETDPGWIAKTQRNLVRLGFAENAVTFRGYDEPYGSDHPFELVFVDGDPSRREAFALGAFAHLAQDGLMVFHDSRSVERATVFRVAATFMHMVGELLLDVAGSNLAVIRKRTMPPYEDWNAAEGRAHWEYGGPEEDQPTPFVDAVSARSARFFRAGSVPVPSCHPAPPHHDP